MGMHYGSSRSDRDLPMASAKGAQAWPMSSTGRSLAPSYQWLVFFRLMTPAPGSQRLALTASRSAEHCCGAEDIMSGLD